MSERRSRRAVPSSLPAGRQRPSPAAAATRPPSSESSAASSPAGQPNPTASGPTTPSPPTGDMLPWTQEIMKTNTYNLKSRILVFKFLKGFLKILISLLPNRNSLILQLSPVPPELDKGKCSVGPWDDRHFLPGTCPSYNFHNHLRKIKIK